MKIGNTPRAAGAVRGSGRAAAGGVAAGVAGGTASPPREIADTAVVMGVPEAELTPKVRHAIMTLMAEVDDLRRQLDQANTRLADLERLADEDTLVPLRNRRAFVRELSRVMSYAERYGLSASLIYFDINHFKSINDRHGHSAGDAALLMVAERLIEHVRESDVVGRLGGDEFGVILVQADETRATTKAQALCAAVEARPLQWEGESIPVTLAFGVCALVSGTDPGEALAAADRAMYQNKQGGRRPS